MIEKTSKQPQREIAAQIAGTLGETGETPLKTVERIVKVPGEGNRIALPMQTKLWFLLGLVLFITPGCISARKETGKQMFEFYSGGAYHFEGYSEWQIKVDTGGNLSISHNVRGEVKGYGMFSLTEPENSELWKLIKAVGLDTMSPPQRAGQPDEAQCSFSLEDENGRVQNVEIWTNDARRDDTIMALVDQIGLLIEQYTGETPILK